MINLRSVFNINMYFDKHDKSGMKCFKAQSYRQIKFFFILYESFRLFHHIQALFRMPHCT